MTRRLAVKTAVTIPDFEAEGIRRGDKLYMALDDFAAWLEATADVFDRAHAQTDIGGAIRACANSAREAKDV